MFKLTLTSMLLASSLLVAASGYVLQGTMIYSGHRESRATLTRLEMQFEFAFYQDKWWSQIDYNKTTTDLAGTDGTNVYYTLYSPGFDRQGKKISEAVGSGMQMKSKTVGSAIAGLQNQ